MKRVASGLAIACAWVAFAHAQTSAPPASVSSATPAAPAASATPMAIPKEGLKPIDIDADVFEVSGKEKKGVFRGNVVARQGDITIRATRVEASYSKEAHGITRAVAEGGVTVTSGTKVGKSDRAEFNNDQHTVVLTGEPRLWEEGSVLEGREIVFHVDDGRVECFECSIDVDPAKVQEMNNGVTRPK